LWLCKKHPDKVARWTEALTSEVEKYNPKKRSKPTTPVAEAESKELEEKAFELLSAFKKKITELQTTVTSASEQLLELQNGLIEANHFFASVQA
jgi:hypothetical protein